MDVAVEPFAAVDAERLPRLDRRDRRDVGVPPVVARELLLRERLGGVEREDDVGHGSSLRSRPRPGRRTTLRPVRVRVEGVSREADCGSPVVRNGPVGAPRRCGVGTRCVRRVRWSGGPGSRRGWRRPRSTGAGPAHRRWDSRGPSGSPTSGTGGPRRRTRRTGTCRWAPDLLVSRTTLVLRRLRARPERRQGAVWDRACRGVGRATWTVAGVRPDGPARRGARTGPGSGGVLRRRGRARRRDSTDRRGGRGRVPRG